MYKAMIVRKFFIEGIHSSVFLLAFFYVAAELFEKFVVFALFTIFLKVRHGANLPDLSVPLFLILRMMKTDDAQLASQAKNAEVIFSGDEQLKQFTDENKAATDGEYSGQVFCRIVSLAAQGWMLFTIVRATLSSL